MGGLGLDMGMGCGAGGGGGIYSPLSFRDEFTTSRLAGAVNGTACEPGSGTRTVADAESKVTISDGKLTFSGGKGTPAYGDPGYWRDTAITRARGLLLVAKLTTGDATSGIEIGFDTATAGTLDAQRFRIVSDSLTVYDGSTASPKVFNPLDNTDYYLIIALRDTGAFFFLRGGNGYFKLLWATTANNTSTLYAGVANYSMAAVVDFIRSPFNKYLPAPILSDSFAAANGTSNDGRASDGLGHLETTGLGSGGIATWSGSSGAIQSNRLVITPGLEHNAATFLTKDVTIKTAFSRSSGVAGVVLGLDSVSTPLNFIRAKHDGTNVILEVYIAGSPTTKATVAATYGADYELVVRRDGYQIWVWYNNTLIGTGPTTTLSDAENTALGGLKAGLYSSSALNSFDNCMVRYTGSNGEYSALNAIVGTSIDSATIYDIGVPGTIGFGVATYNGALPSGFSGLSGHDTIGNDNYGNYQFSDGSIMCWIPKFYYKIYGQDLVDIKPARYFANTAAANSSGYALHRAFIDGGSEKDGFFFDKYECSKNALGTGYIASSIANGNPISTSSAHNPIADLTATSGANFHYSAITAAHARDGSNGAVNPSSIFHVTSRFQIATLALLSLAHAQGSSDRNSANDWYISGSNFPKGNNSNTLHDTTDATVTYTTDGHSNCGKTGSGTPFAKTTHNGQTSGVCDLNGNMYNISIGITCISNTYNITGITRANPGVITSAGHGFSAGDYVQIEAVGGMTELNDKIFKCSWADTNTFKLYAANGVDSLDTSALTAYTTGGTAKKGTFYVAKQATSMKSFTSGSSGATDHWGATGCAAMMDVFVPIFEIAYPNNGFAQKMGDSTGLVLSSATSGSGWLGASLGFPVAATGISPAGTATFGNDYYYQKIGNDMCLLSSSIWNNGSVSGVWASAYNVSRTSSHDGVGFRLACYA